MPSLYLVPGLLQLGYLAFLRASCLALAAGQGIQQMTLRSNQYFTVWVSSHSKDCQQCDFSQWDVSLSSKDGCMCPFKHVFFASSPPPHSKKKQTRPEGFWVLRFLGGEQARLFTDANHWAVQVDQISRKWVFIAICIHSQAPCSRNAATEGGCCDSLPGDLHPDSSSVGGEKHCAESLCHACWSSGNRAAHPWWQDTLFRKAFVCLMDQESDINEPGDGPLIFAKPIGWMKVEHPGSICCKYTLLAWGGGGERKVLQICH